MFSKLLLKNTIALVKFAVIAAIVVVVLVINPWNMFGGGLKLNPTANHVSAIKELGELVTAEYYGETIATYDGWKLELNRKDTINAEANLFFKQFKESVLDYYYEPIVVVEEQKKDKFFGIFQKKKRKTKTQQKLITNSILDSLIVGENLELNKYVIQYYLKTTANLTNRENRLIDKNVSDAIWLVAKRISSEASNLDQVKLNEYINAELPSNGDRLFSDFYYEQLRGKHKKELRKKELAIIGRGWVKAGIDFGELNRTNFSLDKENGIVYITGVKVDILNADINPWFIPEHGVPGFEIIEANRNVDFEDAKIVKQQCIDNLTNMAIKAGIIEQAEKNAKEALKNFISLLSESEIKQVIFRYDKFSVVAKQIMADEFISFSEAQLLDVLIRNQVDTLLSLGNSLKNVSRNLQLKANLEQQLKHTIKELKTCNFQRLEGVDAGKYDRLSYEVYKIYADNIIEPWEIQKLSTFRRKLKDDKDINDTLKLIRKIWYNSELEFINEYNDKIKLIDTLCAAAIRIDTTIVDSTTWIDVSKNLQANGLKLYDYKIIGDSVRSAWLKEFPFQLSKDSLKEFQDSIQHEFLAYNISKTNVNDVDSVKVNLSHLKYPISIPANISNSFAISKRLLGRNDSIEVSVTDKLLSRQLCKYNYSDTTEYILLVDFSQTRPIIHNTDIKPEEKLILIEMLSHSEKEQKFSLNSVQRKVNEGIQVSLRKFNEWQYKNN